MHMSVCVSVCSFSGLLHGVSSQAEVADHSPSSAGLTWEDGRLELEKHLRADVTDTRGTCVSPLVSCLVHSCDPVLKPNFGQTLSGFLPSWVSLSQVTGVFPHLLNVQCDLS